VRAGWKVCWGCGDLNIKGCLEEQKGLEQYETIGVEFVDFLCKWVLKGKGGVGINVEARCELCL